MFYQRLNIVLAGIILLLVLVSRTDSTAQSSSKAMLPKKSPPSTPTPTPTPTPPFPVKIVIPRLNIDSAVEPVGNDEEGTMMLPQEGDRVGWYYSGFKPGEKGNAVIGGHLDLVTGAPAIFYSLHNLSAGDTIEVTDEYGVMRSFIVTYVQRYPYDQIPIESIFGKSEASHLNLITCAGLFNIKMHNYSERLVIYTDLIK